MSQNYFHAVIKKKNILYQLLRPKQNWKQIFQAFCNLNCTIKKTLLNYVFHKAWHKQVVEVRYKIVFYNYFFRDFSTIWRIPYWKCTHPHLAGFFSLLFFSDLYAYADTAHSTASIHTPGHGITISLFRSFWNY